VVDPSRVSHGPDHQLRRNEHSSPDIRGTLTTSSSSSRGSVGIPTRNLGIPRLMNTNGLVDRVNYQLDGAVDTENDRYGLRLFAIADSYVSEVQTVSNSFSPEFGKIGGDIYNVITGSGNNQFHGQVQYIGRPLDLVARPILATPTTLLPVADNFSASASGRLIKTSCFYFASYEHVKRSVPAPITSCLQMRQFSGFRRTC